jgi:hypothetical protein
MCSFTVSAKSPGPIVMAAILPEQGSTRIRECQGSAGPRCYSQPFLRSR